MDPELTAYRCWDVFLLSWVVAALWASRARSRLGLGPELGHWSLFLAGGALEFVVRRRSPGAPPLPPDRAWLQPLTAAWWWTPDAVGWALVALILAGFAFSWWARLHLGRLWSGSVTAKADHRVVDTGPYRLVRHPIYTGLLLSALAVAGFRTSLSALAGFALIALSFWIKARMEERFLRQELGPEAYDAYSRRTPMLIPFAPV